MQKEIHAAGNKGQVEWLGSGLKIQEMQYGFQHISSETSDHDCEKT
jgi:hypothetical protein